jgi:hypothetical protein
MRKAPFKRFTILVAATWFGAWASVHLQTGFRMGSPFYSDELELVGLLLPASILAVCFFLLPSSVIAERFVPSAAARVAVMLSVIIASLLLGLLLYLFGLGRPIASAVRHDWISVLWFVVIGVCYGTARSLQQRI